MATELAIGFVSLTVRYKSAMDQINKDFTRAAAAGQNAGTKAGAQFTQGFTKQTAGAAKGIDFKRLGGQAAVAGKESGDRFAAGFKNGSKGIGSGLAGMLKGPALAGIGAASAAIGVALTSGFSRLTAIDDAKAKLIGLGNDASAVQKIMDSAMASVKGTAFSMGEAATTAATAVAAGIKPGEQLTAYLKKVGDAAAIANVGMSDMGSIFNKVQTNGKAMTDDLQMLADRGIPIFQWLQDETKTYGDDFQKMVEDGKISSEMFQKAVGDNIGGAALKMGDSFSGGLSNLKASMARFGAGLLEPLFKKLPEAFATLTPMIDKFTAGIGNFTMPPELLELFEKLKQFVPTIKDAVGGVINFAKEAAKLALPAVVTGLTTLVDLILRFKNFLIPLVAGLVAYKTTVLVITGITKAWAIAQGLLSAAMTANPIGLIVAAIAALVAGLIYAYNHSETFREVVQKAWAGVKVAFSAAWAVIQVVWEGMKTGFKAVGDAALWLWNEAIVPAWNGIKDAVSSGWNFIKGVFDQVKGGFQGVADFIKGVWSGIGSAISGALDGAVDALKGPLHTIGNVLASMPESVFGVDLPGAAAAKSFGEKLQALKSGGQVNGPGGTDNVLAWLTAGEGVLTKSAMGNGGAQLMAALNAGWVPPPGFLDAMLPGFKKGGVVEAEKFAESAGDGRAYVYGGVGPGYDCSGYMSAIYAAFTGKPQGTRYFTTESDFEALGFLPGNKPGEFNIGVRRGGGGKDSHMAGTLPDGTDVESGGSHGTTLYGGAAAGADEFPLKYYLPVSGGDPGGGGGGGSSSSSSGGGGGGGGGGSDPFSKITAGLGELADLGVEGLKESLLPPGFDDLTQGSGAKSAAALLGFFGGLAGGMPGGQGAIAQGVLGTMASAITGSGSGVVSGIASLIPQPFGDLAQNPADLTPEQFAANGGVPAGGPQPGPGYTPGDPNAAPAGYVDNSVNIAPGGQVNADAKQIVTAATRQSATQQNPQLGTRRWV